MYSSNFGEKLVCFSLPSQVLPTLTKALLKQSQGADNIVHVGSLETLSAPPVRLQVWLSLGVPVVIKSNQIKHLSACTRMSETNYTQIIVNPLESLKDQK